MVEKDGKWVNKADIILNFKPATTTTDTETVDLTFLANAEYHGTGKLTSGALGANTNPVYVDVAAETLEITSFTAKIIVQAAKTQP